MTVRADNQASSPSVTIDERAAETALATFLAGRGITDQASYAAFVAGLSFTDAQLGAALRALLTNLVRIG